MRCKEPFCRKPACEHPSAKGQCVEHFAKRRQEIVRKRKTPASSLTKAPPPAKVERRCLVTDCHRKHYARDLCLSHYMHFRRAPVCSVDGCDEPHDRAGYCTLHTSLLRMCAIPGCSNPRHLDHGDFCFYHRHKPCAKAGCSTVVERVSGHLLCKGHRNARKLTPRFRR